MEIKQNVAIYLELSWRSQYTKHLSEGWSSQEVLLKERW